MLSLSKHEIGLGNSPWRFGPRILSPDDLERYAAPTVLALRSHDI